MLVAILEKIGLIAPKVDEDKEETSCQMDQATGTSKLPEAKPNCGKAEAEKCVKSEKLKDE